MPATHRSRLSRLVQGRIAGSNPELGYQEILNEVQRRGLAGLLPSVMSDEAIESVADEIAASLIGRDLNERDEADERDSNFRWLESQVGFLADRSDGGTPAMRPRTPVEGERLICRIDCGYQSEARFLVALPAGATFADLAMGVLAGADLEDWGHLCHFNVTESRRITRFKARHTAGWAAPTDPLTQITLGLAEHLSLIATGEMTLEKRDAVDEEMYMSLEEAAYRDEAFRYVDGAGLWATPFRAADGPVRIDEYLCVGCSAMFHFDYGADWIFAVRVMGTHDLDLDGPIATDSPVPLEQYPEYD